MTLGLLGAPLGPSFAMLEPSWDQLGRSWEVLGHTLGFRVLGLGVGRHNAYPFEMQKSLSPYACAAKTLAQKSMMLVSIEITDLKNMLKSLSPYARAAKSAFSASSLKH